MRAGSECGWIQEWLWRIQTQDTSELCFTRDGQRGSTFLAETQVPQRMMQRVGEGQSEPGYDGRENLAA